ncbi:MAG: WD40 repeat domain-containing protein, partial [Anaerolineae bacterium]|nr:WD40 repeat domain-containing protein [Anaerolineae bacterium]
MRFLALMFVVATIFNQSEPARFTEVLTFGRGAPVSAAWSPDGETILVNTYSGAWLYTPSLTDKGHIPNLRRAAFAGGGAYITGYDPDNQFALYDATTFTPVSLSPAVTYAWFSTDHQYLAGLDDAKNVWVWSVDNLNTPLELPAEFAIPAKGLFWRPVAKRIAIHTLDGRLIF